MDIFHAIVLGIIEGLTEFLPISSTGHLIVASEMMGMEQDAHNTAFQIIIQVAAILAVVFHYKEKLHPRHLPLWNKIFIAFLPIGIVGYIFSAQIETFFNLEIVAWMFILGGVIFLILERYYRENEHRTTSLDELSYKQAGWVGFAQMFALIPGTSRAGATIVGGMLSGLDRKTSAEFSFLLALPVLAATSGYALLKHYDEFANTSFIPLIVGFIIAFISAYLTMTVFIRFLQHFTFVAFGLYRIIFGIILLVWFV